jgi:hypothetical protein
LEVCLNIHFNIHYLYLFFSIVLFRFAFPRAKGAQWNILLLTFVPICAGIIPYLYALEASARYFPSKRVSLKLSF